jgi:hypothetical protein
METLKFIVIRPTHDNNFVIIKEFSLDLGKGDTGSRAFLLLPEKLQGWEVGQLFGGN